MRYGFVIVGGIIFDIGVGGLILGGGYGWFFGVYGFVIDNLLSVIVVFFSGEIVKVFEDEN